MNQNDIAIIGMDCNFPGSPDINAFWENILNGKECIKTFSDEEVISSGIAKEVVRNKNFIKSAAYLENIDMFDNEFFGISPFNASIMDPQHRLFLQCAWKSFEDAGYDLFNEKSVIGVFAGCGLNEYRRLIIENNNDNLISLNRYNSDKFEVFINNEKDFLPTRFSYLFNLQGPSICIQTGCSTSLVALHLACQSLKNNECDMALVGAVSVLIPQEKGYLSQEGMITSTDGHVRAFDKDANGTVFGSGCATIILKPFVKAVEDRDNIHAIIKSVGINNDGNRKKSFTAPSSIGQADAILLACSKANIDPETISFIEAHGTGTNVGDPTEIEGLKIAFGKYNRPDLHCFLGSVKNNIGHLDVAAGMAGLIKVVLALKNKTIPPMANFNTYKDNLEIEKSNFSIPNRKQYWQLKGNTRRAGISSFGVGGTNVHAIIEEAKDEIEYDVDRKRSIHLLPISAKNEQSLQIMRDNIKSFLEKNNDEIAQIAYTLQVGRSAFRNRSIAVLLNQDMLVDKLNNISFINRTESKILNKCFFVFGENNVQNIQDSQLLYENEPLFKMIFDNCLIKSKFAEIGFNGLILMSMENLSIFQFLKIITQYALANMMIDWGIKPEKLFCRGIGKMTAALFVNELSVDDVMNKLSFEQNKGVHESFNCCDVYNMSNKEKIINNTDTYKEYNSANIIKFDNDLLLLDHKKINNFDDIFRCNETECNQLGIYNRLHEVVARLWIDGVNINWKKYNQGYEKKRVSIPTYWFNQKRFWFEKEEKKKNNKSVILEACWSKFNSVEYEIKDLQPICLILSDGSEISTRIIDWVEERRGKCIKVNMGKRYIKNSEYAYEINIEKLDDVTMLCKEICSEIKSNLIIINMWSYSSNKQNVSAQHALFGMEIGNLILAEIVMYFSKLDISIKINNVFEDFTDILGFENGDLSNANLLDYCNQISLVSKKIESKTIDISFQIQSDKKRIPDQIIYHCFNNINDKMVVLRGNCRWVQKYHPIGILENEGTKTSLNGTYLIIGDMIMSIANKNVKKERTNLVFCGMKQFPKRKDWEDICRDEENIYRSRILAIKELENNGSKVFISCGSISENSYCEKLIKIITGRFERLTGIYYNAEITSDVGRIVSKYNYNENSEKISELKNIDRIYECFTPNFVLLSSTINLINCGSEKLLNVENDMIIETFARARRRESKPYYDVKGVVRSLDYLECNSNKHQQNDSSHIDISITIDQYATEVQRILCMGPSQYLVSNVPITSNMEYLDKIKNIQSKFLLHRKVHEKELPSNFEEISKFLIEFFQNTFKIETVKPETNYFNIGVDSLNSIQIIDKLSKLFLIKLKEITLYEHPTIEKLSAFIEKCINKNIDDKNNVNTIKNLIIEMFQKMLKLEHINPDANYFDLGVDSLNGIQVVSNVSKLFSINITEVILHRYPTIEKLAEFIQEKCSNKKSDRHYDSIISSLIDMFKKVLKLNGIEPKDNFFNLGVDSLNGIQISEKISQLFSIKFSEVSLYKYPSIERLALYIDENQSDNREINNCRKPDLLNHSMQYANHKEISKIILEKKNDRSK